jgi:hypothetical protein
MRLRVTEIVRKVDDGWRALCTAMPIRWRRRRNSRQRRRYCAVVCAALTRPMPV